MGERLNIPVPWKAEDGSRLLVQDFSPPELEPASVALSRSFRLATIKIIAHHNVILDDFKTRELDSTGKFKDVTRIRAKRLYHGGSSE